MQKNPYLLAEEIAGDAHEYWTILQLDLAREILVKKTESLHAEEVNKQITSPLGSELRPLQLMYEAIWRLNYQRYSLATGQVSRRRNRNEHN